MNGHSAGLGCSEHAEWRHNSARAGRTRSWPWTMRSHDLALVLTNTIVSVRPGSRSTLRENAQAAEPSGIDPARRMFGLPALTFW